MFKLFTKKSRVESLQKRYEKLMKEYYKLSTTSRLESDRKFAEAQQILDEIESLLVK